MHAINHRGTLSNHKTHLSLLARAPLYDCGREPKAPLTMSTRASCSTPPATSEGAFVTKLTPPDGQVSVDFGVSIAFKEELVIVGASGDSDNFGRVCVYNITANLYTAFLYYQLFLSIIKKYWIDFFQKKLFD